MITVKVIDTASGELQKLLARARNPRGLLMAAGRAVANLLRDHYTKTHARHPNKLGGKRTKFWLAVKRGVQAPTVASRDSVRVSVTHPAIAQKVHGGEIRAKRVKFLTIPVTPEAYGRTASTFEHETGLKLKALFIGHGRGRTSGILAADDGKGNLTVQYLLKKSVSQKPDPNALPRYHHMVEAAHAAARAALTRQTKSP